MKNILFASAVALGLSTGAAFAATSGGYIESPAMPATDGQVTQQLANTGASNSDIGSYVTQSRPNPTGETEYGTHGAISLWAPDMDGGGN
jgi:hypothetical protein